MSIEALQREVTALRRDVKILRNLVEKQNPDEHWVPATYITDLTGWKAEDMRRVRRQNLIKHKRNAESNWVYLLESLPQQFIIKK